MLNNERNEVLKNYYIEDYINTIRYILTFDNNVNNKYTIDIENKITNNGMSVLSIRILSYKIGNKNNDLLLNKETVAYVPTPLAEEIIEGIRNHFAENHYIIFSCVNKTNKIQTLQNERFTFTIKLNNDKEVEEAMNFNDEINGNDRHPTKVLKLV